MFELRKCSLGKGGWLYLTLGHLLLYQIVIVNLLSVSGIYQGRGRNLVLSRDRNMMPSRQFSIDWENDCFLKDGKPFRYISGSMHYFRVPSFYWEDRLRKMKAAGLNAVETYIAWQVHEPKEGEFHFSGDNDVFQFLELAHKNNLLVILRPGPFIDAERDFGGFPPWLLKIKNMTLRSSDKDYLHAVDSWFSVLLPKLKPFLYENGGPVIMMQVENEYGSYFACDKEYLAFLKSKLVQHLGDSVILFTVDTAFSKKEILCGSLDDLFKTVDFGANTDISTAFDILRTIQPKGPLVNTEFYTGWLDHWGEPHQTRKTELIATALDKILALNASVNLYMFEGGTNFAYWNGAEVLKTGRYASEPTSYDYDAPLSEAGDLTEKYHAIRKVIAKYVPREPNTIPEPMPKAAYGVVKMSKACSLFEVLLQLIAEGPVHSHRPLTMEDVSQGYGYILYRTVISSMGTGELLLAIEAVRDRAIVFVDLVLQGIVDRNEKPVLKIGSGKQLDILVENQGRVNYKYGSFTSLQDPKGILGSVTINQQEVFDWDIFPLPLNNLENISTYCSNTSLPNVPAFFIGYFTSDKIADTFLKTKLWSKGQAFVNGFNLGRYWPVAGPQLTLYLPGGLLRKPPLQNDIILFETDGVHSEDHCYVELVDKPEWKLPISK